MANLATHGGQQESSTLAQVRFSSPIRPILRGSKGSSSSIPASSGQVNRKLSRSVKTVNFKRDVDIVTSETVRNSHVRGGGRVLLPGISSSEEERRLPLSNRSLRAQRVAVSSDVCDGHAQSREGHGSGGNVGDVPGSQRCLSPHSYSSTVPEIPVFSGRRPQVSPSSATVWPDVGSVGIHGGRETDKEVDSAIRYHPLPISGRLAERTSVSSSMRVSHADTDAPLHAIRTPSQRDEVRISANSIHSIPRREVGSPPQQGLSHSRAEVSHPIERRSSNPARGSPVLQSGVVTRSPGLRISDGSVRSPPSPQSPGKSNSGGATRSRSQLVDSSTRSARGSSQVVVEGGGDVSRDVVSSSGARGSGVHRRLHKRMGRVMRRSKLARKVATYRTSHKLVGDEDGTCSPPDSPISPTTEGSTDLDRQFHHGGVSQEGGRHAISSSSPPLSSHPEVGLRPADPVVPTTYRRPPECVSRLSVENGASDSVGVGGSTSNVQMDMRKFSMGSSGSGSLREQSKSSSPLLRIAVPGLGSVGDGRSDMPMAAEGDLRFPADVSDTPIPTSSQAFGRFSVPTSSPVVSAGQVDTSANVVSGNTLSANSGIEGDAGPTTLGVSPPISAQSPATSVVPSWGSLRKLGFSERVVDRIMNARAASTNKQYKSKWDYFVSWSTSSGRDPLAASLPLLTEFLVHVFNDRKVSVRTLKNYRSAIAFYWRSNVGYELPDQDPVLSDLFRSFKRERPLPARHIVQWDVTLVLEFFKSGRFAQWSALTDKELTLKTVFLLALATGKRRSELHALTQDVEWISQGDSRAVVFHPDPAFVSKTQLSSKGLGALRPFSMQAIDSVSQPLTEEDKLLCPVRTLSSYLDRVKEFRSPAQKRLIVSYQRGLEKDLSSQTISRYIKEAIILAHKESDPSSLKDMTVRPHSVRHIATSLSALRGCSLDELLRAGAWASPNVFLSHYVQSFSVDSLSKLAGLGSFVAAGTRF